MVTKVNIQNVKFLSFWCPCPAPLQLGVHTCRRKGCKIAGRSEATAGLLLFKAPVWRQQPVVWSGMALTLSILERELAGCILCVLSVQTGVSLGSASYRNRTCHFNLATQTAKEHRKKWRISAVYFTHSCRSLFSSTTETM